jgi:tetratricopeptide (TPR) repeat protein
MRKSTLFAASLAFWFAGAAASASEETAESNVPLYDDLGPLEHPITTDSSEAQAYFNQGLRLSFGFWWDEAARSFQEAARLDPNAAMAQWGVALTLGPYVNDQVGLDPEAAYAAMQKALELQAGASEPERAYIRALSARYAADLNARREELDMAYANAMRELTKAYPDDLDAATLSAGAIMNTHRWNYWDENGEPRPGTQETVERLESVLARNPDHSGAIHYYIHSVEASPNPDRAVPFADRLGASMPGVAHLQHMPGHIYIQVGQYKKAADSNIDAVVVDERYIKAKGTDEYIMPSYAHNAHFIWSASTFEGRSDFAIAAALKTRDAIMGAPRPAVAMSTWVQKHAAVPLFAYTRFGRWEEILREPAPPSDLVLVKGMWHYARGMAYDAYEELDKARAELAELDRIAESEELRNMMEMVFAPKYTAEGVVSVASNVLRAEILATEGNLDEAIRVMEIAVRHQDALGYMEPPAWHYQVRLSLGALLLDAGRAEEAEATYVKALEKFRENGWALFGLLESLRAQGKVREARAVEARFRRAWALADVVLTSSRF